MLSNADAFSFLLNMFNGTVGMASGGKFDIAMSFASKTLATTDVLAKSTQSKNVTLTSTTIQIILTTASLASLAGKVHPGTAVATIGATFATKISLAVGLAGDDDKKAACLAAIADMAAAGGTFMAGAITTSTGVGAVTGVGPVLIASSIAGLILGGYKLHQACITEPAS